MSQELFVTEELIARQPPEVQAIIRRLLAKLAEMEARLNKGNRPPAPWGGDGVRVPAAGGFC